MAINMFGAEAMVIGLSLYCALISTPSFVGFSWVATRNVNVLSGDSPRGGRIFSMH